MSPLDRRQFVARSLAALGGTSVGALGALATERAPAAAATPEDVEQRANGIELAGAIGFDGVHQAGILTPAPAHATFAALDSVAPNGLVLKEALQSLSTRARELTQGGHYPLRAVDEPAFDCGVLGSVIAPDQLTVTISFGASLFDERYGLRPSLPAGLSTMPNFPNDDLDPGQSHGDVLLQICASHRDTVVHTLRELLRTLSGSMQLRWSVDGFQGAKRGPTPHSSPRNLFAFRDGTANPDTTDQELMSRLVWVAGGANAGWTAGGTFQVVRQIRMHVEFWDRVGLREQENMIGRARDSGAPLGGSEEFEDPRLDLDPMGERIPLDAHIRLANPRTAMSEDQRILRRGYNFHRGIDEAGQLNQGLLFAAYNQDIERQFATIQKRLAEEPMIDYITPVGGGYFFLPPSAKNAGDWVGSGMFS